MATMFCDGASDQVFAGIGVICTDAEGTAFTLAEGLRGTNNVAEWAAVIRGMEEALKFGISSIEIFTDSLLVVNQFSGKWACRKDHLKPLRRKAVALAQNFKSLSLSWIPREQNEQADSLSKEGFQKASGKPYIDGWWKNSTSFPVSVSVSQTQLNLAIQQKKKKRKKNKKRISVRGAKRCEASEATWGIIKGVRKEMGQEKKHMVEKAVCLRRRNGKTIRVER